MENQISRRSHIAEQAFVEQTSRIVVDPCRDGLQKLTQKLHIDFEFLLQENDQYLYRIPELTEISEASKHGRQFPLP